MTSLTTASALAMFKTDPLVNIATSTTATFYHTSILSYKYVYNKICLNHNCKHNVNSIIHMYTVRLKL